MAKEKPFPSLGLRLFAAITSYNLGHNGVDYLLKQHADEEPGEWWEQKAREIQREALERISPPKKPGPKLVH